MICWHPKCRKPVFRKSFLQNAEANPLLKNETIGVNHIQKTIAGIEGNASVDTETNG
jgi:hypothetical protein